MRRGGRGRRSGRKGRKKNASRCGSSLLQVLPRHKLNLPHNLPPPPFPPPASLFVVDIWIMANGSEDSDVIIDGLMFFIFVSFTIECVILTLTHDSYFNGFFFYMDVIGTLSMILDISWMSKRLGLQGGGDAQLLRAARSAKIGAKSSRLAKLTKVRMRVEEKKRSKVPNIDISVCKTSCVVTNANSLLADAALQAHGTVLPV